LRVGSPNSFIPRTMNQPRRRAAKPKRTAAPAAAHA
jgi:hypothetical protein